MEAALIPLVDRAASSETSAELTVNDLLGEASLGLSLVAGAEGVHQRAVREVRCVEADHAWAWGEDGVVILRSAAGLPDVPAAQRRLIASLAKGGCAALAVCLARRGDQVPSALAAEADRRGLPLITVPGSTPPREVTAFVQRALVSDEAVAFSRMSALQRFLLDAVGCEDPQRVLLGRLADLVHATVAIHDGEGRIVTATGALPATELADAIRGLRLVTAPIAAGGVHGHAFSLGDPEAPNPTWLTITAPERRHLHPLTKAAGAATVPLLAAIARLDEEQHRRDAAAREAALSALLDAASDQAAKIAAAEIGRWGIEIERGVAAVAIEPPRDEHLCAEVLDAVIDRGTRSGLPVLGLVRDEVIVLLVPAPVSDDQLEALLNGLRERLQVGVGRTVDEPCLVRKSLAEARLAAQSCPEDRSVGRYDDLPLASLVMQELPLDRLRPKIEAWLGALRSVPHAYETLVTHFGQEMDVGRTAQVLHLHPNSVRYRLNRVEELLGASLRSPETVMALYVAMSAPSDVSDLRA